MKRLLILLLILPAFISRAYAQDDGGRTAEIFQTDRMEQGLNPEEAEIIGRISLKDYDPSSALKRLWRGLIDKLNAEIRGSLRFASELIGLILLCALAASVCTQDKIRALVEIGGACAAAALLTGSVSGLVQQTAEAAFRLSDYSKAALPVVYTAAAASGAVSSSAVRYAAASLAIDVMMSLMQRFVIPLIYTTLALTLANVVFPNPILALVEKLARWAAKTVMTGGALAFTSYLSMSAVISTSVDAAALKATRSVISGALPVVGGMLSDASAAVLSASAVVRSCTGVFGLIAVCAMCLGPFVLLTVKTWLFKIVAAVADATQNARLQKLFSGVGSAVGMLMGLLGCCALMLFLSFTAAMKSVSS